MTPLYGKELLAHVESVLALPVDPYTEHSLEWDAQIRERRGGDQMAVTMLRTRLWMHAQQAAREMRAELAEGPPLRTEDGEVIVYVWPLVVQL